MKQNKKSEMGFLMTMILILVSGLVLLTVFTQFGKKVGLEGAIQSCRFSVLAQSYTEVAPSASGWKSPLDIECNTRYVTFKNTEVLAGLDPDVQKPIDVYWDNKKVKRIANLNEYVVNQVVAEEVKICWFQFAEGKVNVFPNDEKWFQIDDDVCFICTHIDFDLPSTRVYKGLYDFMDKTVIKSEGMTYIQYLSQPSESDATWKQYTEQDPDDKLKDIYGDDYTFDKIREKMVFNSAKSYAIVFRRDYDSSGIAGVVANDKDNYYLYIMPDDKINEVCDLMAN